MNSQKVSQAPTTAFLVILAVSGISFAQGRSNSSFASIKIRNFGQMDQRFYRGAQPNKQDYKDLKGLGIKTVINLRSDPKPYEKRDVESLGMRYVNIPMSDSYYPKAEQVSQFLKLVDDPSTGKFFVHCTGGRHRTGVMGAVYRFSHYHWNLDQVYAEMKKYDFYTKWGHGKLKDFVHDYSQSQAKTRAAVTR